MAPELSSGATVGGFRVESLLAPGAMAEVYRARGGAGQPVAVKLLDPALAQDERFRQRNPARPVSGLPGPVRLTARIVARSRLS